MTAPTQDAVPRWVRRWQRAKEIVDHVLTGLLLILVAGILLALPAAVATLVYAFFHPMWPDVVSRTTLIAVFYVSIVSVGALMLIDYRAEQHLENASPKTDTERTADVTEYGDRLAEAVKIMRGEADELAARDGVDDHLQDVIDGLRHHARSVEEFLESEYYVQPDTEPAEDGEER